MKKLKLLKEIILFALPIVTGQIGQMLFGVEDIMIAGHYSPNAVATIGVANAIFIPFLMVGIGLFLCLGPLAAELKGAGKNDSTLLFNSYLLATFVAIILTILMLILAFHIDWLKLNPEISQHVALFLKISAWSLFPALIFQATKEYLQAMDLTYFPNALILFFNIINLFLCSFLMFGSKIIPEMGVTGAAVATNFCRFSMCLILFFYMKQSCPFKAKINPKTINKILKIGLPIAFTIFCEVLIFSTITILIGQMGLIASASQSLVMNLTSLTFMIPLSIGSATSVLVGRELGKKSRAGIINYSLTPIFLTLFLQTIFALFYLLIPEKLIALACKDPLTITYASSLLFWVGIFQIPDGLQVVLSGVMRGLQSTRLPMLLGFISYWIIGLPIGLLLTYRLGYEARGLWMGLSLGLLSMCLFLSILYYKKIKSKMFDTLEAVDNPSLYE